MSARTSHRRLGLVFATSLVSALAVCATWATAQTDPIVESPAADPATALVEADRFFQARQWEACATAYEAITESHPNNGAAWFRLGYARHALGQMERAIEAHLRAAQFPAFRSTARYNLACAYALTGERDLALGSLGEAIDAGFTAADGMKNDPDLASLRSDPQFGKLLERATIAVDLYRQFDFWLGEWDVIGRDGSKVGTSKIARQQDGFIILENWTSASGGTGTSINFVDPVDKLWKQVWVDAGGGVVRYQGRFTNGAMRFMGTNVDRSGRVLGARAVFTPLPDGRVRQFIEHSTDGRQNWYTYFDGLYVPRTGVGNAASTP